MADSMTVMDRRLTVRLLAYWEKLRKDRSMPAEQDFDPDHIQDLWDNCFLVRVADKNEGGYHYTHMGKTILAVYYGGTPQEPVSEPEVSGAEWFQASCTHAVKNARPIVGEGEFRNVNNDIVRFRQCLLPLGEEGNVHAILGGMSCKLFPDILSAQPR